MPPELVDVLLSADADTFVAIILSASCWSNLDRAMIGSFLLKSFAFIMMLYAQFKRACTYVSQNDPMYILRGHGLTFPVSQKGIYYYFL